MTPSGPRRLAPDPWDIGFGAVMLAAALAAVLLWFPNDIRGGFMEDGLAGKRQPGDAFFPVLLALALAALAGAHIVLALRGRRVRPPAPGTDPQAGRLSAHNLGFLAGVHLVVFVALALMYWLGPALSAAMRAAGLIELDYRQLSDTAPYKYLGYLAGGFAMTASLIAWAEGRVRARALLTVAVVLGALLLLFDIVLDNVQLPPNADW